MVTPVKRMARSNRDEDSGRMRMGDADAMAVRLLRERVGDPIVFYRFGSTTGSSARSDSDVDYAVLASRPLEAVERFDLQEDMARALGRSVDLVDLRRASTVMRMQVVSTGEAIAVTDLSARERFEIFVYASYARLNEERRAILEQIELEGTVYGR
jgi:predicted nucleotidyltransferase